MRARPNVLNGVMCVCAVAGLIASSAALGVYNADGSTWSVMNLACHWRDSGSWGAVCSNAKAALYLMGLVLFSEILVIGNVAFGCWKRKRHMLFFEGGQRQTGEWYKGGL